MGQHGIPENNEDKTDEQRSGKTQNLADENMALRIELEELRGKHNETIEETKSIASDNTNLVNEINFLRGDISKMQKDLNITRRNNTEIAVEYDQMKVKYREMEVTSSKSHELALNTKNRINKLLKDAKEQNVEKDREIRRLTKINEKLQAENTSLSSIIRNKQRSSILDESLDETNHMKISRNRNNNRTATYQGVDTRSQEERKGYEEENYRHHKNRYEDEHEEGDGYEVEEFTDTEYMYTESYHGDGSNNNNNNSNSSKQNKILDMY